MHDERGDAVAEELRLMAARVVATAGGGRAQVDVAAHGHLVSVQVTPHRRGAAAVSLTPIGNDEVAGVIGRGAFSCDWGDPAADEELEALLTLVALGQVEERWSLGCRLRARPLRGRAYTFGQWSPLPWWVSIARRYQPFDPSAGR